MQARCLHHFLSHAALEAKNFTVHGISNPSILNPQPMDSHTAIAILSPAFLIAIGTGTVLLKRAYALPRILPEEFALAFAWVFLVGSLVWLAVFLSDSTLLGFGTPWTWLATVHFAFAGFGALTITALSCRVVVDNHMKKILRALLWAHPAAYVVTAAGISGYRYCNELGAVSYEFIFATQLWAVVSGKPERIAHIPRRMLLVALTVPVITLLPAIAWAWGRPIFDLAGMVRYHGLVNAIGHVGLGLAAFGWGRPSPQPVEQTVRD